MRVIIVEDDTALRLSLTDWLSKDYLVSHFESAEALLEALNDFDFEDGVPTCMLLDFQMPGMNGVELQTQLHRMGIEYPVIFMSGNAVQADIIDAWHGGAVDFLLKPFNVDKLSDTFLTLFQKCEDIKSSFPPAIHKELVVNLPISQREAEVLLLLGTGHKQHDIAKMLHVTLRTVKWHRANLKDKLDLNTLVELARYCIEHRASIENIATRKQKN
ncbi:MAG: response regulator [Alcaligenaceae bacterium]